MYLDVSKKNIISIQYKKICELKCEEQKLYHSNTRGEQNKYFMKGRFCEGNSSNGHPLMKQIQEGEILCLFWRLVPHI